MVYRFKFRIWGGKAAGEYVFILQDGTEVYLNGSFQPFLEKQAGVCLLLAVREGRALLTFLGPDLQWNGKPAPREAVELHPGHLVGRSDEIVEVLECPENTAPARGERTRFLDIGVLKKSAAEKGGELPAQAIPEATQAAVPGPQPEPQIEPEIEIPLPRQSFLAVESSQAIEFGAPAFSELPPVAEPQLEPAHLPPLPPALSPPGPERPQGISGIRPTPDASPRIGSTTALTPEFASAEAVMSEGIGFAPILSEQAKKAPFNWQAALAISACLSMIVALRLYIGVRPLGPAREPVSAPRFAASPRPKAPPAVPAPAAPPVVAVATVVAAPEAPAAPAAPEPSKAAPPSVAAAQSAASPAPLAGSATVAAPPAAKPTVAASELKSPEEAAKAEKAKSARIALFLRSVEKGRLAEVQQAIEQEGLSQDFSVDDLGRTPLVRAAAFGRLTVMKYLLEKKADIHALDFAGNNALMWAVMHGHEKTVRFLLEQGLDRRWKRDDGADALRLARKHGQKQIEKLLVAQGRAQRNSLGKSRMPASKKK